MAEDKKGILQWLSAAIRREQKLIRVVEKEAVFMGSNYNQYAVSFTGEKNFGELGPLKNYYPDYDLLRIRSWQSYNESEISKTVLDKFVLWMVSRGLKLQSNPDKNVLASEGINEDSEKFNTMVEARFSIWAKSKYSSWSGEINLHETAKEAYKNAKIGGDVLVILRYDKDNILKVQLIDGAHVQSPVYGNDYMPQVLENGNTIRHGIEMAPSGEHVAYHVRTSDFKFERILAKNEFGLRSAFLVYGNKARLNNHRGMPLIAVTLETLAKLERYKEATVGSAEERQKIVYQIVHDNTSTGESPLLKQTVQAISGNVNSEQFPKDSSGRELANTVAATTNKQTYNMPIGSELKALESKNELFFKEFYQTNSDIICAALGIPPNVAFSIYNDSFSASRAATKDWEHTITVNREEFSNQFYQHVYNFWLHMEILQNKITTSGYLTAYYKKNWLVVEAYRNARFTGPMFPHIDPLKEVKAEREKLGPLGENLPLTTLEQATEALNGGDSNSNLEQFSVELKKAAQLQISANI